MGTIVKPWLAVAVLAAGVLLARHFSHAAALRMLQPGDRLTAISLQSLSGAPVTLAGRSSHPRLFNIFATWCGPCNDEMPQILAADKQLQRKGIRIVGIDQQEPAQPVVAFAQRYHIPYRILIDAAGITHHVFGARFIPTTIAVDRDGVLRAVRSGPLQTKDFLALARAASKSDEAPR